MALEQLSEIFNADLAFSNFYQSADNAPHHTPEKMRSRDSELNDVLLGFNCCAFAVDNCGFARTRRIGSAEAQKVMTPNQHGCGFGHLLDIQFVFDPPHVLFYESLLPARNLIQVDTRKRVVARMEIARSPVETENRDVGGEQNVQSEPDCLLVVPELRSYLDLHDPSQGVYPRIRSAGALH